MERTPFTTYRKEHANAANDKTLTPGRTGSMLDDFLFNALLAYPEYGRRFCRKFLKILFGREFKNLNIVTQKSYGGRDTGLHGARLDVYIEEGDEVEIDSSNVSTIYDIEPDKNNKRKDIDFIAQRTRFYHAIIDSRSLKAVSHTTN